MQNPEARAELSESWEIGYFPFRFDASICCDNQTIVAPEDFE
jgi:hypothetical protein